MKFKLRVLKPGHPQAGHAIALLHTGGHWLIDAGSFLPYPWCGQICHSDYDIVEFTPEKKAQTLGIALQRADEKALALGRAILRAAQAFEASRVAADTARNTKDGAVSAEAEMKNYAADLLHHAGIGTNIVDSIFKKETP
jgi:hypothetical protein